MPLKMRMGSSILPAPSAGEAPARLDNRKPRRSKRAIYTESDGCRALNLVSVVVARARRRAAAGLAERRARRGRARTAGGDAAARIRRRGEGLARRARDGRRGSRV